MAFVALVVGLLPRVAAGMVTQPPPGNEVMPQPANAAEVTVVVSRGFSADAVTLAALFTQFGGGGDSVIDPVRDARVTPGTFSPTCGLSAAIVLHGGACRNALGWYNATEPATLPTAIYPFVPADLRAAPPNGISCGDSDFCPLATRTNMQAGRTWSDPLYEFDPAIRTDAHWNGGKVGLALIGVSGSLCPQTKYSQAELNDKSPSGAPWVTALVYQSVADPGAHYLAFEDAPTCPQSWRGCTGTVPNQPGSSSGNDGDFNDAVFYVRETACASDGGAPAGTGGAGGAGGSGIGGAGGAGGVAGMAGSGASAGSAGTGAAAGTTGGAGGTAGAGEGGLASVGGSVGTTGAGGAGGITSTGGTGGTSGAGGTNGGAGGASAGGAGAPTSGGGCGCRVANARGGAWSLLIALVVLRRRRRPRS